MNQPKKKKRDFLTPILFLVFFAGLSLLLYPTVSNYWNSLHQSRAISAYADEVAKLDRDRYDALWKEARDYNASLLERDNHYVLTAEQAAQYDKLLNVSGTGVMGYIEIPIINCSLSICHGTSDSVLQTSVGHLDWTSLPAGGESTHTVLSAHRGLPSAKLFTDLDRVQTGDTFLIRVLDEVMTYEVDQILIVEPHEVAPLLISEGEDLCTLITCTPYGINTHRLLVRGHRVDNQKNYNTIRVTADAIQIEPTMVAPIVSVPMLMMLVVWLMIRYRKKH